jgi:ribulose-phosphate 3-epimerase
MPKVDIVPAILVKDAVEFSKRIALVEPFVSCVQIDIMDGNFVPNETLQPKDFPAIPKKLKVEYHLMVDEPLEYVRKIGKKNAIYEFHIESFSKAGGRGGKGSVKGKELERRVDEAIAACKKLKSEAALVLSPDTPAESLLPFKGKIRQVLVMTVYPGFSGQSYIAEMEKKMKWLTDNGFVVEVDGGIDIGSAKTAARAGAILLGVASGIFAKPDIGKAIDALKKDAES